MKERIDELSKAFRQLTQSSNMTKVGRIQMPPIQAIKAKFEITGTADVIIGKHYGVAIKDEGDFTSVRFGSIELTEVGSMPTAERNFTTQEEAFAFVEQIQNHVRRIVSHLN